MFKKYFTAAAIFIILNACSLQAQPENRIYSGTEIDILPFATGGYYISAWAGADNVRFRAVITKIYPPDFVMPAGMSDLKTDALALIADYFPFGKDNEAFSGLWTGAGIEYWMNEIKEAKTQISGDYNNLILTAGAGYIIPVYGGLYINPWAAIHYSVTGTEEKLIGKTMLDQKKLMAEFSLKIGWQF